MRNRPSILTYLEILEALHEDRSVPTGLAQVCNINYVRLHEFADLLETKGFIRKELKEGH